MFYYVQFSVVGLVGRMTTTILLLTSLLVEIRALNNTVSLIGHNVQFIGTVCEPNSSYEWQMASSYSQYNHSGLHGLNKANANRYRDENCQLTIVDVQLGDAGVYCICDEGRPLECALLSVINGRPTCQWSKFSNLELTHHMCYVSIEGDFIPQLSWNYDGNRLNEFFFPSRRPALHQHFELYITVTHLITSQNHTGNAPHCEMTFGRSVHEFLPEYFATMYTTPTLMDDCMECDTPKQLYANEPQTLENEVTTYYSLNEADSGPRGTLRYDETHCLCPCVNTGLIIVIAFMLGYFIGLLVRCC